MNLIRECPECGEPVTGRTDKVYCSTRCKSDANKINVDKSQLSALLISEPSPRRSVDKVKQPAASTVSKYELQLRKMECDHQERLKKMEFDERERDRNHRLYQVEKQLKDERLMMAEMILRLQSQYRQLTGQPTRDLPDANTIKSLKDLERFAYLPAPEKVESLPTAIKEEAKVVFTALTNEETEEWTEDQLTEAVEHISDLLGLVKKWQRVHPKLSLIELPVYTIAEQLERSLRTYLSKLKRTSSIWGEPTVELKLDRALVREIKRFLVQ